MPRRRRILPILLALRRAITRVRMRRPPLKEAPPAKDDATRFGAALARLSRSGNSTPPSGIAAIPRDTRYEELGSALLKVTLNDAVAAAADAADAASEAGSGRFPLLRLAAKTALITGLLAALGIGAAASLVSGAQSATTPAALVPPNLVSNLVSGNLASQVSTLLHATLPSWESPNPTAQPGNPTAASPSQDAQPAHPDPAPATAANAPQQTTGAATSIGVTAALPGSDPGSTDPNSGDPARSYPSFGNLTAGAGLPSRAPTAATTDLGSSPLLGAPNFGLPAPQSFGTAATSSPATAPVTPAVTTTAGNNSQPTPGTVTPGTATPRTVASSASAANTSAANTSAANTSAGNAGSDNALAATIPTATTPSATSLPDSNPPASGTPGAGSGSATNPPDSTAPTLVGDLPPTVSPAIPPSGTAASSLGPPVDIPEPASLLLLAIVSAATCLGRPRRLPAQITTPPGCKNPNPGRIS